MFKCEMSSKVICHMIRVASWQRCTYGADLEWTGRERHGIHAIINTYILHNIQPLMLDPREQTQSSVNIGCSNVVGKHEEMQVSSMI